MPRQPSARNQRQGPPPDIIAIRNKIKEFLDQEVAGKKIGNCRFGVYVFYDYDGEPIYVGQTYETLRTRIRRHLTNQRTDAVAMNVLDPFEVAEIEVWPFWKLAGREADLPTARKQLSDGEYTVFQKVLRSSSFKAVLNEKNIVESSKTKLPPSYRGGIIPEDLYLGRKHPDARIARRASTIANLARVISEREVSAGLRRTLVTQAQRLERLASRRFQDFAGEVPAKPRADEE
ncbi:MAG: GIY-YIG nuclease family protein [Candidatus Acidiferrales bacterium]